MGGSQVGNRAPAPPRGPMGPPRPLMMGVDGSVAEEPREEEVKISEPYILLLKRSSVVEQFKLSGKLMLFLTLGF